MDEATILGSLLSAFTLRYEGEMRGAGRLFPACSAAQAAASLTVHFFKSCFNTVQGSARAI